MSNFTSINPSQFTQLLNALNNGGGGGGGSYTLPIASDNVLGGVKIGNGLSIENDGKLNATVSSEVQYSTVEKRIGTWVDGTTLYEKTLIGTIQLEGYNRAIIGNKSNLLPNSNIKIFNCTMSSDVGIINESRADVFFALDESGDLCISQKYTTATKTWTYNIRFRYTKN